MNRGDRLHRAEADALAVADILERSSGAGGAAPFLYGRLAASLQRAIEDGELAIGSRLPSERALAASIGRSRTTVQAAYRELAAMGYVRPSPGSGTYVRARPEWAHDHHPVPGRPRGHRFAHRERLAGNTFLLDLMQAASERFPYGFETGSADGRLLPVHELAAVAEDLFSHHSLDWVSYSPTSGIPRLRQAIVQELLPPRGLRGVAPDEVLVVTGSMQGLDLISKLFLDPGDAVVVENPTFPGALQVFRGYGARLVGVPVDGEGMRTETLPAVLEAHRPKLIYVQPTLHNPTGATLRRSRRAELLSAAEAYGVPVVEDDAYGLLVGTGGPLALKADDAAGNVLYLSTMSKILAPGLRLGYLVAGGALIERLAQLKQLADLHTSTVSQFLVEGWLGTGDVRGHLARCQRAYAQRLAAALRIVRPAGLLRPFLEPNGGMYLFCGLPPGLTASALRRRSGERGVIFAAGDAFSPDGGYGDHLRLSFSTTGPAAIRVGLDRLQRLIADMRP